MDRTAGARLVTAVVIALLWSALTAGVSAAAETPAYDSWDSSQDRIVGTYYFMWYKYGEPNRPGFFNHITNPDGSDALTFHPPHLEMMDYTNVEWHKLELLDMIDAGIDVVIVDWWAGPSLVDWSIEALRTFAQAQQELIAAGYAPPKVAMLYETAGLIIHRDLRDLTQGRGLDTFYQGIRVFFHLVPPALWARWDGRPMIWTYVPESRAFYDRDVFNRIKARFDAEFGVTPYVIKEASWNAEADASYHWGAALTGVKFGDVVSVSPGWDARGVPGNTIPPVSRRGGARYETAWLMALARRPRIVVVETWNELHEGTNVMHTVEHGRLYIELTAKHARQLKGL
ncbi:MAG TPA: DUF5010 domain-containing protein [Limnochordia bacterium]